MDSPQASFIQRDINPSWAAAEISATHWYQSGSPELALQIYREYTTQTDAE